MGILSRMKEKALQREPRAPISEDIKAHVLGEYPPPPSQLASERHPPGARETEPGTTMLPELPHPATLEAPEPVHREPLRREEKSLEYEILDRLALIEAQLGAIRAQVETVNERMKNLELGMKPRAPATRFY